MGLNPSINRKTLQQLEPPKANAYRKACKAEAWTNLHSPTVDQGQDGGMQMEKLTAVMSGQNLSVHKQIY